MPDLFKGRTLVMATMHGKDLLLAPMLEQKLGVKVIVPEQFNTDLFGTFSGETERKQSQPETARLKAEEAIRITGADLALASEGTFQPHHVFFMAQANYELLLLKDARNNAEWQSWEVSLRTTSVSKTFHTPEEALKISKQLKFPSHAAIIKTPGANGYAYVQKGLTDKEALLHAAREALNVSASGAAVIENDLRAHMNPTRQKVIMDAGRTLLKNLASPCSRCEWPGFSLEEKIPGLPCSLCGSATRLTQYELFTCNRCSYKEKRNREDGKRFAEPENCDSCNP